MKIFDKKTQIKFLNIILIVIWMITVFCFSNQQGAESGDTSRKFTVVIIQILTGKSLELDDPFIEGIQLVIRKLAHFMVYAIGGFLMMNYAHDTNISQKQKLLYSISFGEFYAITDELHQFFVPGRSGNIVDVGIDTLGVITGVMGYVIVRKILEKIIRGGNKSGYKCGKSRYC